MINEFSIFRDVVVVVYSLHAVKGTNPVTGHKGIAGDNEPNTAFCEPLV